mmetsp:Transcript_28052/g.82511  ORF Transcript_28052/g.82511 Transcript_28052/m.82511 type:complete len:538 (-) Transcript_28052:58-1671(-)
MMGRGSRRSGMLVILGILVLAAVRCVVLVLRIVVPVLVVILAADLPVLHVGVQHLQYRPPLLEGILHLLQIELGLPQLVDQIVRADVIIRRVVFVVRAVLVIFGRFLILVVRLEGPYAHHPHVSPEFEAAASASRGGGGAPGRGGDPTQDGPLLVAGSGLEPHPLPPLSDGVAVEVQLHDLLLSGVQSPLDGSHAYGDVDPLVHFHLAVSSHADQPTALPPRLGRAIRQYEPVLELSPVGGHHVEGHARRDVLVGAHVFKPRRSVMFRHVGVVGFALGRIQPSRGKDDPRLAARIALLALLPPFGPLGGVLLLAVAFVFLVVRRVMIILVVVVVVLEIDPRRDYGALPSDDALRLRLGDASGNVRHVVHPELQTLVRPPRFFAVAGGRRVALLMVDVVDVVIVIVLAAVLEMGSVLPLVMGAAAAAPVLVVTAERPEQEGGRGREARESEGDALPQGALLRAEAFVRGVLIVLEASPRLLGGLRRRRRRRRRRRHRRGGCPASLLLPQSLRYIDTRRWNNRSGAPSAGGGAAGGRRP